MSLPARRRWPSPGSQSSAAIRWRMRPKRSSRSSRSNLSTILIYMAILVTPQTKVLVQGITGEFGGRHAKLSIEYGSAVVAGVTPGKGGQLFEHAGKKVPIFN